MAKNTETTTENTAVTKSNEIVEKELKVMFASYDDGEKKISVLAAPVDESESPSTLTLRLQAYNEETRKYYDDEETSKAALERLEKTGLTLDDIKGLAFLAKEFVFTAYTYEGRITFTKPQRFVRANPIGNREAVQLDNLEVVTLQITDQTSKHRFRTVIEVPIKVKGQDEPQMLGFNISQLIFDDPEDLDTAPRGIGLKYATKEITEFEQQLADSAGMPEQVADAIKAFLVPATERARAAKVEELKEKFGFDMDEVIEKGQLLRLKLHKQQVPNSDNFYLQADLLEIITPEEGE